MEIARGVPKKRRSLLMSPEAAGGGFASKSTARRTFLAAVALAVVVAVTLPYLRAAARRVQLLYSLSTDEPSLHLLNPVGTDPRKLVDTWGGVRSENRRHEGIDLFAPRGTPVRSTTRGLVTKVGTNRLGGQVVGVLGPGWEWHYYAHLDSFGRFRQGDLVNEGDVIGYVGSTGNARGTPPHLHYGIYRRGAINPYPRLVPPVVSTARRGAAHGDDR
jgi:peptidoglycan LD-endopeptidase LytH